ncbi:MAG: phosphonopyruvate decarboxylase [Acetobacteraceae bacterium]|nr:phosphonopyruvate decarboxylase [Acetobacteraceae bacterium]
MDTIRDWPADIFAALKAADIRQVAYVPDAGHGALIRMCHADPAISALPLTTEEEGIGLATGAWLGGVRACLLMQSSGVGNCINMLSLAANCRSPLLLLVTMRGDLGETNPWQIPMGQAVADVLRAMGVVVHEIDRAEQAAGVVAYAAQMAFDANAMVAVLIRQALIGAKRFVAAAG